MFRPESSSMLMTSPTTAAAAPWTNNAQTISFTPLPKGAGANNNCSSSSENTPRPRSNRDARDHGNVGHSLRVLPDFAQVYGFIGSVFDPYASNHLQKLKKMDPIDVETVLLLMRNLSINLSSPDFEDHVSILLHKLLVNFNSKPYTRTNLKTLIDFKNNRDGFFRLMISDLRQQLIMVE
jgi:hypothetical protein